jgi:predicted metal-dependent HD superfamily phosphohydrolase
MMRVMTNEAVPDPALRLYARWRRLLPQSPAAGTDVIGRYADPARSYHNLDHLEAVLDGVALLCDRYVSGQPAGDQPAQPHLVELAAWFHDAVYDVRRDDNEEKSAELAEHLLAEADTTPADIAEVARLVRLTATHDPAAEDVNGAVLCDADLAVLSGDERSYDAYARAVRAEYGHVGDEDFRRGRAAVLRQLLALPALFRTPTGRTRWETPARRNLRAELARLG